MESVAAGEKPPQVSLEQQASAELVKRIRKLRWMGMEEEARDLEGALVHACGADSVLAGPHETD